MKLSNQKDNDNTNDLDRGLLLETKPKTKKPSMYNVLLLNDDYTPMEFVVLILEGVFNKKQDGLHNPYFHNVSENVFLLFIKVHRH